MLDGRVCAQAAPADLYGAPPTLAVARFLGTDNEVRGRVGAGRFEPLGVPVGPHGDGPAVLTIRPEVVRVASQHPDAVAMTVRSARFAGEHLVVELIADDDDDVVLTAHAPVGTPLTVGGSTTVHLPPDRCVVFDPGTGAPR